MFYILFQCSKPCHFKTYYNEKIIREMVEKQRNMRIPTELIPHCPICGELMSMNLRCDDSFVEDGGWHKAYQRYYEFLEKHKNNHVLFLELGVGFNTPGIIKYPFWRMTMNNPKAVYVSINIRQVGINKEMTDRSIYIEGDIGEVLKEL